MKFNNQALPHSRRLMLSAFILAGCALVSGVKPVHAQTIGGAIHPRSNPNLCLDVSGASHASNSAVIVWECHGGDNQKWIYVNNQLKIYGAENKCLDVSQLDPSGLDANYGAKDGARLIIWDCGALDKANQKWKFANGTLSWGDNTKCLDAKTVQSGDEVISWTCHNGANQQWIIDRTVIPSSGVTATSKSGSNAASGPGSSNSSSNSSSSSATGGTTVPATSASNSSSPIVASNVNLPAELMDAQGNFKWDLAVINWDVMAKAFKTPPLNPQLLSKITDGYANFKSDVLTRVNAVRATGVSCGGVFQPAVPALTWSDKLFQAAAFSAADMARVGQGITHTASDGTSINEQFQKLGYPIGSIWGGQNVAAGYGSVKGTIDGWVASAGHCKNIMSPNFKEVGVSVVRNNNSTYHDYWTMDLIGKP